MKKIKSLTEAQKAKFPEYIDKWTRIGLETAPANRKLAEDGIIEAYKAANLDAPKIVWCDSPLSMGLTRAILKKLESEGDLKEISGASVWASVGASVWDSVGDSVWASVWASVGASVRDSVRDSVWDSGYGQHDANWIGYYDYFRRELGLNDQTAKLQGLTKITQNAGWFLPHKGICWISDRHCVVMQDERKRLHCEIGPAVKYPDGWSLYYWHGTKIPAEWIEDKKSLTPETVLKWDNLEQRRAGCELIGWATILKKLKAKTIDKDPDPQIGELVEVEIPDSGKERFLFVQCGTKREFALCVPKEMKTALAANLWTYNLPENALTPEIRT